MKLGKLLGAGKSFFGGGTTKAYREKKGVYLPKFNAEKNPFTPKAAAPAVAAPAAEMKKASAGATAPAAVPALAKPQKMAEPTVLRPVRAISWKDKLNPFRTPDPVAPLMVGAVQVELSLDAVKPIANDLADADIEVVPVRSSTVTPVEPSLIPATRQAWEFTRDRMAKPV